MCKFCDEANRLQNNNEKPKFQHYLNRAMAIGVITYLVFWLIK